MATVSESDERTSLLGGAKGLRRVRTVSTPLREQQRHRSQSVQSSASRQPYHYEPKRVESRDALALRYRYYGRLDPRSDSILRIPDHVVPDNFFSILTTGESARSGQSSIVTVFSIWNTMVGSALLSMPWALEQSGLGLGLFWLLVVPAIALYTCYRIVRCSEAMSLSNANLLDMPDICRHYWGKKGDLLCVSVSIVVFVGADITYWILMSDFLYNTGAAVYETVLSPSQSWSLVGGSNHSFSCDVVCPNAAPVAQPPEGAANDLFYKVWQLKTVPILLAFIVYPMLNFRKPTIFTKFNGLGTLSIVFLLVYVGAKLAVCGVHMNFSATTTQKDYFPLYRSRFPAQTGTLMLSFFLHNAILPMLRNQRNPRNNVRDLTLGYGLATITYLIVAAVFYISYPLAKTCISDNLLKNFPNTDLLTLVARVFLLFQILTVYPLISYLIRAQLSYAAVRNVYPGLRWVMLINLALVLISVLFAIFVPTVGSVLRFVGSFAGLMYMFVLPCAVYLRQERDLRRLSALKVLFHGGLVVLGLVNLVGQFLIL